MRNVAINARASRTIKIARRVTRVDKIRVARVDAVRSNVQRKERQCRANMLRVPTQTRVTYA